VMSTEIGTCSSERHGSTVNGSGWLIDTDLPRGSGRGESITRWHSIPSHGHHASLITNSVRNSGILLPARPTGTEFMYTGPANRLDPLKPGRHEQIGPGSCVPSRRIGSISADLLVQSTASVPKAVARRDRGEVVIVGGGYLTNLDVEAASDATLYWVG
jgi:hypothetical protein